MPDHRDYLRRGWGDPVDQVGDEECNEEGLTTMKDPIKSKERARRYRERLKVRKYGPSSVGVNMTGRHGNHARGHRNGRWNQTLLVSSHGYVLVRVERGSPNSFGPSGCRHAYCYEHIVVMSKKIGRPISDNEVVHHKNGNKTDNRPENLELLTRSSHASEHANHPNARDTYGRFTSEKRSGDITEWPEDLRVREFPWGGAK